MKRKKHVVKIKRKSLQNSTALILIVVLFCLYCGLLIFQRSSIIALDTELRDLETQYNEAVQVNDDLQAKLMRSSNLSEIENYAANVLGMIKPQNSYISYVSYNDPSDSAVYSASAQDGFISWINNLFN